jgi:regulator of sigma E protease
MDFLGTVWFWVLAALGFGFVIFIHELGHFLFAKWAGVRVDRFSIGFGPVILRRTIGETEYALSLLPLGGYVKMLGQEDLPSEVAGEAKTNPRSYLAKSPGWQAAILLGGVLFNLISSYLILLGIAWYGKQTIEPVVGAIQPTFLDADQQRVPSPAARLGLHVGDRVLTVNGERVREFDDLAMTVVTSGNEPLVLEVERQGPGGAQRLRLPPEGPGIAPIADRVSGRPSLGIEQPRGTHIADVDNPFGPLPAEVPRVGETIVGVAGVAVPPSITGQQLDDLLLPYVGRTVTLELEHEGIRRSITIPYAGGGAGGHYFVFPPVINGLEAGGAAQVAGIQPGDIPLSVNGQPVPTMASFFSLTRASLNADQEIKIVVWRAGKEHAVSLRGTTLAGRRLLGAGIEPLSGHFPVVMEGSPLAQAGFASGDSVIGISPPQPGKPVRIEFAVVSGGSRILIPVQDADLRALERWTPPGIARVFGAKGTPSLLSRLGGRRVENVTATSGLVEVSDRDGVRQTVGLQDLDQDLRGRLADSLVTGDWITGLVPTPTGRALEVIRGASATPRSLTVTVPDHGAMLFLERVKMTTYQLESWTEAFTLANAAAYNMVVKTLQIIPRFFRSAEDGGLDPSKSLTGPIGIFNMLKGSAERFGILKYLELMALIGLNLFLINLLPIPVTDGGQLMFLAIETATGRPLAPWARNFAMWIGLLLVASLMIYVIGLDVFRLLGLV